MEVIYKFVAELAIQYNIYVNPIIALIVMVALFFQEDFKKESKFIKVAGSFIVVGLLGSSQAVYMNTIGDPGSSAYDYPFWVLKDVGVTLYIIAKLLKK